MAAPCPRLMDDSLATAQPPGGDSLLARKPSDTWSSESTVVPEESGGCGNCIIDFLHLRPHAVDAVVDDTAQTEDVDVCSSMMEEEDHIMIDESMSEEDNRDNDVNIDTKKPPPPAPCQDQGQVEEAASPCYYPSTPEDHMESKKPSTTTPPPLNHRRRDNNSCLDIITNNPPSSSAGSISVELHQQSSELSIPTLSRILLPPESLPQSHLIRATTNDDNDDDDAPLLSLNSMSTIHANPNEAMMPPIPRIHLQMRQSSSTQSSVNRVIEGHRSRLSATQQTVEETRQHQRTSGFVPIQQNTKAEGDDDGDEER